MPESQQGLTIMAEVCLCVAANQALRVVVHMEEPEFGEQGIYLGTFATFREIKLVGEASVSLRGKLYLVNGGVTLRETEVHLDQFGAHPVRLSPETEQLLIRGLYVRREIVGGFTALKENPEFTQLLAKSKGL